MHNYYNQQEISWDKYVSSAVNDMVDAGVDILGDLKRRDFTINAMGINAKGEIENVMGQKGFILEQIEDEVLFYDNPEYELKKDNLSSKIKIHQIPKGVKYTVSVIVKKGSGDPIDELMVESGNGGTEEKYPQNENSFLKIFAVTIVAFIAGALWAIKIY